MMTKILNLSNSKDFVSNEYLQSKKIFDRLTGPVKNIGKGPISKKENPFMLQT